MKRLDIVGMQCVGLAPALPKDEHDAQRQLFLVSRRFHLS